jgi:hypothetical protein
MEQDGFVDISVILRCAVYALLKKGTVVYIGQSRTPYKRLNAHASFRGKSVPGKFVTQNFCYWSRRIGYQFDEVWVRPCVIDEVDAVEREMIRKYRPKHNVRHNEGIPEELKAIVSEIISAMPRPPPRPALNIRRRI